MVPYTVALGMNLHMIAIMAGIVVIVIVAPRIWRLALSPLALPEAIEAQAGRERVLVTCALICQLVPYIGWGLMVAVYILGLLEHGSVISDGKSSAQNRVIPNFRLLDLLTMIFSLGLTPLLCMKIFRGTALYGRQYEPIISAVLMFPAVFICMLHRFNINKVDGGVPRTILLFLSPYILLGCAMPAYYYLLHWIASLEIEQVVAFDSRAGVYLLVIPSCVGLVLVYALAWSAKAAAEEASAVIAGDGRVDSADTLNAKSD